MKNFVIFIFINSLIFSSCSDLEPTPTPELVPVETMYNALEVIGNHANEFTLITGMTESKSSEQFDHSDNRYISGPCNLDVGTIEWYNAANNTSAWIVYDAAGVVWGTGLDINYSYYDIKYGEADKAIKLLGLSTEVKPDLNSIAVTVWRNLNGYYIQVDQDPFTTNGDGVGIDGLQICVAEQ